MSITARARPATIASADPDPNHVALLGFESLGYDTYLTLNLHQSQQLFAQLGEVLKQWDANAEGAQPNV